MESVTEIECDLVVIGAGYAGINAFNAACKYLEKGSKVVVIDKKASWGGQWVDQYDFVRLHQAYEIFTAGERRWKLDVPWWHLASKKEILNHFEDIAATCREENDLNLIELFEYEAASCSVPLENQFASVVAKPIGGRADLPIVKLKAQKVIKAIGYVVPVLKHFEFSCKSMVYSMAPVDVLTPEWNTRMTLLESDKPIYVIGSGKSALDVMYCLTKKLGLGKRLHCIAGHGTYFVNRDVMSPRDFMSRSVYGSNTALDWLLEMLESYDGDNALEVCHQLAERDFLISPIEGTTGGFMFGSSDVNEVTTVKNALSPQPEKVIKAHLVNIDIGPSDNQVLLKLRSLDKKTYFDHPIAKGSFIINCTEHFQPQSLPPTEPVLSSDGRVLAPQMTAGFSGPSANLCTHLFYQNALEPLWRDLPRLVVDVHNKPKFAFDLASILLINSETMTLAIPGGGRKYTAVSRSIPLHRVIPAFMRFKSRFPKLREKMCQHIKTRYTDESKDWDEDPICGLKK